MATTPATPTIDLSTFTTNFDTKVSRFELYPADEPTCYVVGFSVTHKTNNKSMYQDTQVLLADISGKTDDEIIEIGWVALKESFKTWAATVVNKPQNSTYTPTTF
jgi:hypothetical protein